MKKGDQMISFFNLNYYEYDVKYHNEKLTPRLFNHSSSH